MFPFRDHNPSHRIPYVNYGLIAINVGVFLLYFPLLSGDNARLSGFFAEWATVPADITAGINYHTVLTSMFLHAGWMHLIGNMLYLWIFGDNLEDAFGHIGYLLFYIASGIGADLLHVLSDPASRISTVGASGAIAGVLGGYLLLYPRARVDVVLIIVFFIRRFALPAWVVLGFWFGIQLFYGAASDSSGGGVAYWAHAGGFAAGFLLTLPLWLWRGGIDSWTENDGHPPHPATPYEERMTNIPVVRRRR